MAHPPPVTPTTAPAPGDPPAGTVPMAMQGNLMASVLEAHWRTVLQCCDDAIISKTLDGRVTSWSAGAERMFGYSAAEMIGRPILQLIPAGRRDEETFILERLAEGESLQAFETVRICKDGQLIDVSVSVVPLRDAAGQLVGATKIVRDISRLRQQQRLETVLDIIGDGLWDWDIRSGRVVRSGHYYRILGTSDDTGDFDFFKRQIDPQDLPAVVACIEDHVRGNVPHLDFAFRLRAQPGQPIRWLRTRGRVIERDAQGNPVRILGILSDITAQQQAAGAGGAP